MQEDNQILYTVVGKILKNYRKSNKIKFTNFCYANNIPLTTLNDVEKGKNQAYLSSVFKIVKALGLSYEEFGVMLDKELPKDMWKFDE